MVKVTLTVTRRPFGRNGFYSIEDEQVLWHPSLAEAKKELYQLYRGHKKSKCYIDIKGEPVHCGYVYHLRTPDCFEQHWTHFKIDRTINLEVEK